MSKVYKHLTPRAGNSHSTTPSRLPHAPHVYVPPSDRIPKWNIRVGDKVRLIVGKPSEKFLDESQGKNGGWKVYKVKDTDMKRNRVFLEGLNNLKKQPVKALPDNFETFTEDEKRSYTDQTGIIALARPIHYSNVQLCVKDAGPNSIFASRISTGQIPISSSGRRGGDDAEDESGAAEGKDKRERKVWDKAAAKRIPATYEWKRYAAKLSGAGEVILDVDQEKGLVEVGWPAKGARQAYEANDYVTKPEAATKETLAILSPDKLAAVGDIREVFPRSSRSPPPPSQKLSDEYVTHLASTSHSTSNSNMISNSTGGLDAAIDTIMPLYLTEELSPRFSRAKQTTGWNLRRQLEIAHKKNEIREKVETWDAEGRDINLSDVLESDEVGLEGLTLRPRTFKEVKEATGMEVEDNLERLAGQVRIARRFGKVWDQELYNLKQIVYDRAVLEPTERIDYNYLRETGNLDRPVFTNAEETTARTPRPITKSDSEWERMVIQFKEVERHAKNGGEWEDGSMMFGYGPTTWEILRKRGRKARKLRRRDDKLTGLRLDQGRNMVVPKELRAEV